MCDVWYGRSKNTDVTMWNENYRGRIRGEKGYSPMEQMTWNMAEKFVDWGIGVGLKCG